MPTIKKLVSLALMEDLGPDLDYASDLTGQLTGAENYTEGFIATRENGILAGTEPAELAFLLLDKKSEDEMELEINWLAKDGDSISPAKPICKIKGSLAFISAAERTALNFLSHLSGVATLTSKFVNAAMGGAKIFDTRKTTPGLRTLEKSAVVAGGGYNHRFSLQDAILIKDNHLTELDIEDAIKKARSKHPDIFLEVECDTKEQVMTALLHGADAVLLDNMTPEKISECVRLAEMQENNCITEASGGITLENISAFAKTGIDRISVGAITKSAPALDMGLDIYPI